MNLVSLFLFLKMAKRNLEKEIMIWCILALFAGLVIIGPINRAERNEMLQEKHLVTKGRFTQISFGKHGAVIVEFPYHGRKIKVNIRQMDFCKLYTSSKGLEDLYKYEYPIIYYPGKPEVNKVLLYKKDYVKYKIEMPEEIKPTIEKHFDCN